MSNNQDWYDDEEDFDFEDNVGSSNQNSYSNDDVLKKVRRADRAKEKRIKELEAELGSLRKFQREATVSKVLAEKGVNPKIAAFIPQDIELTTDAVGSWLEQYGDVFGVASTNANESASVINPNDVAALQQMNAATDNAYSPEHGENVLNAINNATTEDELLSLIYGSQ